MVLIELARFVLLACTDLSMLPALDIMRKNYRHFELFIGIFQICISFCFNVSGAFHADFFLHELEWHFISDVLSITYYLLLCVHLMGFPDENTNIILRYVAFALSWLTKSKDQWDSTVFEALLIIVYGGGALARLALPRRNKPPIQMEHVKKAGLYMVITVIAFLCHTTDILHDSLIDLTLGISHVAVGFVVYHGWQVIPCRDLKKYDSIPLTSNYT